MPSPAGTPGRLRARARGFGLVEIMVAVVVGLLGTVVIFQVFALFEGQKRTTTSGGDAQQNGLLALYTIERDARMAGYGINYAPLLGCNVLAYDAGPPVRNFNFTLVPLQISDGASGAPDSVTIVYGNSNQLMASVKLLQAANSGDPLFVVDNTFGVAAGDAIVAGEVGKNCSLGTVNSVAGTNVNRTAGTYIDAHGITQTARYNKNGGLGVDYGVWNVASQTGGRVFDLGLSPSVITYSIQNSQLMVQDLLTGANAAAVLDGVVQLQAQYGRDTDGDGAVDAWSPPAPPAAPATPTDWSRVLALRIAVVARSQQPERPDSNTGVCNTTTAAPTWSGGSISLTADVNWKCYRYRVFEAVIPVRNQIWVPQ